MSKRIKVTIIIVEIIMLLGLSGYRVCECLNNNNEEIKENENNNDQDDDKENISDATKKEIKILVYEINIRQEPDVNSPDIGDVYMNQVYEVLDIVETDTYTWYKIKKDNIVGYVANQKGEEWVEYNELDKNDSDNENSNIGKLEELDINSDLVKSLVSPLENNSIFGYATENKLLAENFDVTKADNNQLLSIAYNYYFFDSNKKILIKSENIDYGTKYTISSDDFKEHYYSKIFGPDVNFNPQNMKFYDFSGCGESLNASGYYEDSVIEYNNTNNSFSWVQSPFGCIFNVRSIYRNIVESKAEQLNDEIYIYYYIVTLIEDYGSNTCTIYDVHNQDNIEQINATKCKENGDMVKSIENRLESLKQENKIPIYKATFKKQSDGNYYFNKGEWVTK